MRETGRAIYHEAPNSVRKIDFAAFFVLGTDPPGFKTRGAGKISLEDLLCIVAEASSSVDSKAAGGSSDTTGIYFGDGAGSPVLSLPKIRLFLRFVGRSWLLCEPTLFIEFVFNECILIAGDVL